MDLIVAAVEWGDYLGRGAEYVTKLRHMVARNMTAPYEFTLLTDSFERHMEPRGCIRPETKRNMKLLRPGLTGWWNKIALFAPGAFQPGQRVLFLDLDVVITGPLMPLFERKGIIHLRDWGWQHMAYGSGVMVWDAGEHSEIWSRFTPEVPQRFRGDQDWLFSLGGWEALSPQLLRSYRYHSKGGAPEGCSVVSFHGNPKPHELGGWVAEGWR